MCQRFLGRERGSRRTLGGRKGDEERISLRVDLDAAMRSEGLAQKPAMLGERVAVRLAAERMEQACGALDVSEEEGDGAGRQVAAHGPKAIPVGE
jgi:hypothetical protein